MTDNSTIATAYSTHSSSTKRNNVLAMSGQVASSGASSVGSATTWRWNNSPSTSLTKIPIPAYSLNDQSQPVAEAEEFYVTKLRANPNMARYNAFMASIAGAQGDRDKADRYHRQAVVAAPGDVLNRNDFAIHLAGHDSIDKKRDAVKELHKAMLVTDTNALLHKNMGALHAKVGDYHAALRHSDNARFLNANDSMTHRNLAKLHAVLGDTHKALEHNLQSIQLEDAQQVAPHTSAYRAAAVQIISKGGNREEALALMKAARAHEQKTFTLSTTQRTNEILDKVRKQQQQILLEKEMERRKEEEREQKAREDWMQILKNAKL